MNRKRDDAEHRAKTGVPMVSLRTVYRFGRRTYKFVTSIAFSADGHRLASTADDTTVRIWETTTGNLNRRLMGTLLRFGQSRSRPMGCRLVLALDKTVQV